MSRYLHTISIRWSDLDANRHLANTAYQAFMAHVRTSWMREQGYDLNWFLDQGLGPVVLRESIHYFKEITRATEVYIDLALRGISEDGRFWSFEQRMYTSSGKNVALYRMTGAWIDLIERKTRPSPPELLALYDKVDRTPDFRILAAEDMRIPGIKPLHREPIDN